MFFNVFYFGGTFFFIYGIGNLG